MEMEAGLLQVREGEGVGAEIFILARVAANEVRAHSLRKDIMT